MSKTKIYLCILILCLINTQTNQEFLPFQNNSESLFLYEIVGHGQVNHIGFGFDSKFTLHITKLNDSRLLMNITEPAGKVGNEEWSLETLVALEQPFYINLNATGTPTGIEYDIDVETNYTIARKELILKQLQDIFNEHKKYQKLEKKEFNKTETLSNMPFGSCETNINMTTSIVYTSIEYDATAEKCKDKIDPFYTLDMDVDVYPQSEFRKSFAFTIDDFTFQYVRLDARLKLKSEPEMDVDIYSLITFNGFKVLIEEEEEEESFENITSTQSSVEEDSVSKSQ